MHATLHYARRAALVVAVGAAVSLLAGCDLATAPGDGSGGTPPPVMSASDSLVYAGVTAALDTTDLTAILATDSDTGDLWASLAPGTGAVTTHERQNFRREISSSTRNYQVTTSGDTTTVVLTEDRVGVLHVRADSVTTLDRPFTDHGERTARAVWVAGFRPGHDSTETHTSGDSTTTGNHDNGRRTSYWKVLSSTVLNRWSTSVTSPVQILYVVLQPENEPAVTVGDPALLVSADQWPRFPNGRTTNVTVRIANASAGTQVVLHDRFEKNGRRIGLTQDAGDPTLFHGTWRPSMSGDGEKDWHRLLTIDVIDGTTLSADAAASYNSRQWVIPVAFNRPRR